VLVFTGESLPLGGPAPPRGAQRAADRKAKADVAEQRKKDGILGNIMKGNFSAAWDNTVNEVWGERLGNSDWRKHKAVDTGVKILATEPFQPAARVVQLG
jgi:hypothetical protein